MPELPEVQTTVNGARRHTIGLTIIDVWSGYSSTYFNGSKTIKDPAYFKTFKKEIVGCKIISVERRGKNILINLSNIKTILVHMKMTGHLLYGLYNFEIKNKKDPWQPVEPEALKDIRNRLVRFVITFDNGRHLALSDMRKFAKITLIDSEIVSESVHLKDLGPEPLDKSFDFKIFNERLNMKPNGKIKLVIMDQNIISGIGNIYADESLWRAGIHPLRIVHDLDTKKRKQLFEDIKKLLKHGIDLGGDSMSDYRNILGEKGRFQEQHHAYKKKGAKCDKPRCKGIIRRIIVGGRGTHYCDVHQK